MASYSLSYDSGSVTFRVAGLTRGQYVELYLRFENSNSTIVSQTYTATGSALTKTFDVLSPGKEYAANVKVGANSSSASWIGKKSFTAPKEEKPPSVESWSWDSSNGSASALQTSKAYSAIREGGSTSDFSYLVWNDMVDKVKEILDAKNMRWDDFYASYYATKMSSFDRTMTATKFNSLRYNIGIHYATGIQEVKRGDTVYGWYFTRLTSCMNDWI